MLYKIGVFDNDIAIVMIEERRFVLSHATNVIFSIVVHHPTSDWWHILILSVRLREFRFRHSQLTHCIYVAKYTA